MKTTEHYGLNVPEAADILSVKPFNENAQKLDEELKAQSDRIAQRLKMVSGSYTGNGKRLVTIETSGITPAALLVKRVTTPGAMKSAVSIFEGECRFQADEVTGGWILWRGEDIAVNYYKRVGTRLDTDSGEELPTYLADGTTIQFTPKNGGLTWKLAVTPDFSHGAVVNNEKGATYEWIAFGMAEE